MKLIPALLLCVWISLAQSRFEPSRVLPSNSSRQVPLEPAMTMSIYGEDLGPDTPCIGYAGQHHLEKPNPLLPDPILVNTLISPKELCGVQVFVGQHPAGLLYVSAKQINFKVPQETGIAGTTDLRVLYKGRSSLPAIVSLALQTTRVLLDRPAYVGMPVWLRVEHPLGRSRTIQYPYVLGPAGFGCNTVEVRRVGVPLPIRGDADWMKHGMTFSGFPCGSFGGSAAPRHLDRLPIHLLYRFDAPGTYEVRLSIYDSPGSAAVELTRSEWTPIEIEPAQPGQRTALLNWSLKNPPSAPAEILSSFLPDLLGFPDDQSFEIISGFLYHPDGAVRRYARTALSYWPDELVAERILQLLKTRGPSDEIVYLLQFPQQFFLAHAQEILQSSLPFADSGDAVLHEGTTRAIERVRNTGHVLEK